MYTIATNKTFLKILELLDHNDDVNVVTPTFRSASTNIKQNIKKMKKNDEVNDFKQSSSIEENTRRNRITPLNVDGMVEENEIVFSKTKS